MIRAGERRIWKPKEYTELIPKEELSHPWYGQLVKVLQVEENAIGRQCLIIPVAIPAVNNPHAFEFWADECELEQVR